MTARVALFALSLGLALPAGADDSSVRSHDPLEGMNRGIFWFNEKVDHFVLEPVSVAWDFVLPDMVQDGIRNVFDNARFPVRFVNDLLQWKPRAAGEDLARFLLSSTLGMGGLFDAGARVGIEGHDEDFGQTLGVWGVPPGPYLVLPLLGPSTPRDTVGLAADSALRIYPWFAPFWVNTGVTGTNLVNQRSLLIDEIRENRARAIDYYAFVRNAYLDYRRNQVLDRSEDPESQEANEELYELEDDL